MKLFTLLTFVSCFGVEVANDIQGGNQTEETGGIELISKIVRGIAVKSSSKYPWIADIRIVDELQNYVDCMGVIIDIDTLLTAAHCIVPPKTTVHIQAHIVDLLKNGPGQGSLEFDLISVNTHPLYHPDTLINDISVWKIRIRKKFRPTTMKYPILNNNPVDFLLGVQMTIAGFGKTEKMDYSSTLREALIPLSSRKECLAEYPNLLPSQFCAGAIGKADTCQGDSGGPIFVPFGNDGFLLVGLVSYSSHECAEGLGVYTAIDQMRNFIALHSGPRKPRVQANAAKIATQFSSASALAFQQSYVLLWIFHVFRLI